MSTNANEPMLVHTTQVKGDPGDEGDLGTASVSYFRHIVNVRLPDAGSGTRSFDFTRDDWDQILFVLNEAAAEFERVDAVGVDR